MKSKPFIFSDSELDHESLVKALSVLKVDLESIEQQYTSRTRNLRYPWQKDRSLVIEWVQQWWPDGEQREDTGLKVFSNGQLVGFVEFRSLSGAGKGLRQQISLSILNLVKQAIE